MSQLISPDIMTDLRKSNDQNHSKFNVYFQNKRIRQHLIKAGLIDVYGVILPPVTKKSRSSTRVSRQPTSDKASTATEKYAGKEKPRHEVDSLTKRSSKAKVKKPNESPRHGSRSVSAVPRPALTTANEKSSPKRQKSVHRLSKKRSVAEMKTSSNKDQCRVEMIYYGSQTNLDYDHSWSQREGDEIVLSQQHCGGENLIVFKGFVKPDEKFVFHSRRHEDYPFGLAIYINGLASSRISVCCEYRHKLHVPLGGEQGLFGIVSVRGGKACTKCQYKQEKKKKKKKYKALVSLNLEPSRYRKSIVPRASSRSSSSSIDNRPHTPTPPLSRPSTKRRSPDLTRTPTPTVKDNRRAPSTSANTSDKPIAPVGHNASIQKSVVLQDNDENKYSSDFDESDEGPPETSSLRSDQPHLSKTRLIGNQRSIRQSSGSSSDDDQPKQQTGKNESADLKKKSDPIDQKNTNQLPKVLPSGNNNVRDRSPSSSSSISGKPTSSHKQQTKRVSVGKNDKEQNRSPSTVRPKTAGRDRRRSPSSSSIEGAFGATPAKTNADNQHSAETDVNVRRLSPSSSDNFLGLKRFSSNQQTTTTTSSVTRHEKVKKTDPEARSWFEDDSSDHND